MPYGLHKLTAAANTEVAKRDWIRLTEFCNSHGRSNLVKAYDPPPDSGWRRIDRSIGNVRSMLGVSATWSGDNVLEGLPERNSVASKQVSLPTAEDTPQLKGPERIKQIQDAVRDLPTKAKTHDREHSIEL